MKRILLGTTKDNMIVFGNYEMRTWNGYPEFSASFDSVYPFKIDEDEIQGRLNALVDYDLPNETIIEWCNEYKCCPDELADTVYSDLGTDELIEMTYDTSLYPNTIYDKNGDEWNFESSSAGQYDPRPDMAKIYDTVLFNDLMYLWDTYHLKTFYEKYEMNPDYPVFQRMEERADKWSECRFVEQNIADFINKEMI